MKYEVDVYSRDCVRHVQAMFTERMGVQAWVETEGSRCLRSTGMLGTMTAVLWSPSAN